MTELQINKSQLNTNNKRNNNNITWIEICGNFLTHDPTQPMGRPNPWTTLTQLPPGLAESAALTTTTTASDCQTVTPSGQVSLDG